VAIFLKIEILMSRDERLSYCSLVDEYLQQLIVECEEQDGHVYFQTTLAFARELRTLLGQSDYFQLERGRDTELTGGRKAVKYIDFMRAYRLVKYQYSRYSQLRRSYTEAVYASFVAETLRFMHHKCGEQLKIMDAGCGPSRLTYEYTDLFPHSEIHLYDYSIVNLYFAWRLISSGKGLKVPYRIFSNGEPLAAPDTALLHIPPKTNPNVLYRICDLSRHEFLEAKDPYDLIVANHSINLTFSPKQTIERLVGQMKPGGYMILSDLLGWKESRPLSSRDFPDGHSFYYYFRNHPQLNVLDYFMGGPYCEEVNEERMDTYVNHFIVLQKR
jgi:SAM-dependent methyltransferase